MALPRRLLIRLAVAGALAIAVLYGVIVLYATVVNDAPDALDSSDLEVALDLTTIPDETISTDSTAGTTSESDHSRTEWRLTDGSQVGYRVAEVLFGVNTEGVGRTDVVTGGITIVDGVVTEGSFDVDVASMTSDDGRRDNQFRGRIMDAATYPIATFTITEPIVIGADPDDGVAIDTSVLGELTLRGETRPVTASLSARLENGRIGILGSVPVVFTDFGIVDPSLPGITVEPEGLVEFVLVLSPVG